MRIAKILNFSVFILIWMKFGMGAINAQRYGYGYTFAQPHLCRVYGLVFWLAQQAAVANNLTTNTTFLPPPLFHHSLSYNRHFYTTAPIIIIQNSWLFFPVGESRLFQV